MEIELATAIFFESRLIGVNNYSKDLGDDQVYYQACLHIANFCFRYYYNIPIFSSGEVFKNGPWFDKLHELLELPYDERLKIPDPQFIIEWRAELTSIVDSIKPINREDIIEATHIRSIQDISSWS